MVCIGKQGKRCDKTIQSHISAVSDAFPSAGITQIRFIKGFPHTLVVLSARLNQAPLANDKK